MGHAISTQKQNHCLSPPARSLPQSPQSRPHRLCFPHHWLLLQPPRFLVHPAPQTHRKISRLRPKVFAQPLPSSAAFHPAPRPHHRRSPTPHRHLSPIGLETLQNLSPILALLYRRLGQGPAPRHHHRQLARLDSLRRHPQEPPPLVALFLDHFSANPLVSAVHIALRTPSSF